MESLKFLNGVTRKVLLFSSPGHTMSYYVILCHTMPYYVILCHSLWWCEVVAWCYSDVIMCCGEPWVSEGVVVQRRGYSEGWLCRCVVMVKSGCSDRGVVVEL